MLIVHARLVFEAFENVLESLRQQVSPANCFDSHLLCMQSTVFSQFSSFFFHNFEDRVYLLTRSREILSGERVERKRLDPVFEAPVENLFADLRPCPVSVCGVEGFLCRPSSVTVQNYSDVLRHGVVLDLLDQVFLVGFVDPSNSEEAVYH